MYLKATEFCRLFEDVSVKMYFVNKKYQTGETGAALILLQLSISISQSLLRKDEFDLSDTGGLLAL